ncbi:MAG: fatty acid desaturase [Candidatus Eremiobacteraeota bacterium]|nr:fatty acid desaturase [Candidatus Eremiobacteraeota bacterium]
MELRAGVGVRSHPFVPEFAIAAGPAAERRRRRAITDAHPDVRALIGTNPWSALLAVAVVAAQLGTAAAVARGPAWAIPIAAFAFGAFGAAAVNALIHEACHALIFRTRRANRAIALIANLGLVTWTAMPFFRYHARHHNAMGDYAMDVGIPTRAEAAWVGNDPLRKALWLAAFPYFQWRRVAKFRATERFWDGWMIANAALQILVTAVLLLRCGPGAIAYLLLSQSLATGFHPLGTRVIQEHVLIADGEETNDYISWASPLELNFGYHAEHHDFPRVPWNRLPRVLAAAPEFYRTRPVVRSRIALMARFILDPRCHLYRHAVRRAS